MKKLFTFCLLILCNAFLSKAQTPWLHTEGNKLKDPEGNEVILRGVDFQDIAGQKADQIIGLNGLIDKVTDKTDTAAGVLGWHTRVIRFAINPGITDFQQYHDNILKPAIDYATSKGVYVIIDNHFIADVQPNIEYTDRFWSFFAPRFRNYPNVIFEIYNEPINAGLSWSQYRPYMQKWIDLVRSHAPHNLILAGTPQWCQRMSGAVEEPFTGDNIMYVAHHYPSHKKSASLVQEIEKTAAVLPVFMTEWGFSMTVSAGAQTLLAGTVQDYGTPIIDWAENLGIHWTAWCADDDWEPAMFTRSEWRLKTGNDEMGGFVKQKLFQKKDIKQPVDKKCLAPYIGFDKSLCSDNLPLLINSGLSSDNKEIKWYRNGELLNENGKTSLSVSETGIYKITVDSNGCSMSDAVQIVDTLFPVSITKSAVVTDSLLIVVGDGKENLSYKWYRNTQLLPSVTTNSLKIKDPCETVYKVEVSYPKSLACGIVYAEFKVLCPREMYLGEPLEIPGRIEAEYFDKQNMPDVALFDKTPGNRGGALRPDEDVDIQKTLDDGGGFNIYHTDADEFIEYTVKVRERGIYDLLFRVASSAQKGGVFSVSVNNRIIIDSVKVPNTTGGQIFEDVLIQGIRLYTEDTLVRLDFMGGRISLNYFDVDFVKSTVGTKDQVYDKSTYLVYPNPAHDHIIISSLPQNCTWKISNLLGEDVLKGSGNTADLSQLQDGQYLFFADGIVTRIMKR